MSGGDVMRWWHAVAVGFMLAAMPASNNFGLNSYGFGTGSTANSSSTRYRANAVAGDTAGSGSSTNYKAGVGETFAKQANVPTITLTNGGAWYNKLQLVVGPENNPSDATFAIAISTDSFTTTQYVKADLTIGSTLTQADYLTYAAWGSASGSIIRGLRAGAVYTAKAKAYRGSFTESPYGPVSSASTANPQLAFDIDVSATDTSTSPPYAVNFGSLLPGTVVDSPTRVWVSLDTNAESGANVYVSGANAGLRSSTVSYTIGALSGDLSAQPEGYGVQGASATQTSGGPLSLSSPYDGTGQTVGVVDALIRQIFSAPSPVTGGRGSFLLKAKSKALTPASNDYTEIVTAVAAANF